MNIVILGSGGREHALSWKISQSRKSKKIFAAPGNIGMALDGVICTGIGAQDFKKIAELIEKEKIEFVVVGPDQALADGAVDFFESRGIACFGPTAAAARLESSKAFAKDVMAAAGIPTARFAVFHEFSLAKKFVEELSWPNGCVVKADGLALGKGVVVCASKEEAFPVLSEFMEEEKVGTAGKKIVIEERLEGREVSAFFFCDGVNHRFLTFACDYKQLFDGGRGPNTGGMGTYTPADWLPEGTENSIGAQVVEPLLKEMLKRNIPYKGILFIGLMMTQDGAKVLEFNARFGDPETQSMLPLMDDDVLDWLLASRAGALKSMPPRVRMKSGSAVHVVLAASGYPDVEKLKKGDEITIDASLLVPFPERKVFFAGATKEGEKWKTAGGRVLGFTALGKDRAAARAHAYDGIKKIKFNGMQMRSDIGG